MRRLRIPSTSVEGDPPDEWKGGDPVTTPYYHLTDAQSSTVAMVLATGMRPVVASG